MTVLTAAFNGCNVEDMGLRLADIQQWLSPVTSKYGTVQIVGQMGQTLSTQGVSYDSNPLTVSFWTPNTNSPTTARAVLGATLQALQGLLEIEVADMPGRVTYGVFESAIGDVDGGDVSSKLLYGGLILVGTIRRADPFWYTRSPVSIGGTTNQRIAIPFGTAPSLVRFQAVPPYTNPAFTVRNRSGIPLAQMRFTDIVAGTDIYLDANGLTQPNGLSQAIDRISSGVRTVNAGWALLNDADTFLRFDPLDGTTLEISSGSFTGLVWQAWIV